MLRKSLFLLVIAFTCFKGNAQIYVNEFSNGPSGTNQEFVELVVSNGIPGSTVDIRGWIIDDNSGYWSCGVGWGIASGHLRFAQINNWRCVPTGSIILLYNDQNKHPLITQADDPTDANNDGIYIVPISAAGFFDVQLQNPNTTLCNDFTGVLSANQPNLWNYISLNSTTDGVVIKDPASAAQYFHAVCYGTAIPAATRPALWFNFDGLNRGFRFENTNSDIINNLSNWSTSTNPLIDDSPGRANGPRNQTWISSLKLQITASPDSGCAPLNVSLISNSMNAGRTFTWNFGDGSLPVNGTFPATHPYNPGTYFPFLTITATNGCVLRDTARVVVGNFTLSFALDDSICAGDTAILNAFGGPVGTRYFWFPDSLATVPSFAGNPFRPIGLLSDTSFFLTTDSASLCGTSNRYRVKIAVTASNNILPQVINDTICLGDTAQLVAFGSGVGAAYRWYSAQIGGSLIANIDTLTLTGLLQDTSFYVSTGNGSGCSNNNRIRATVVVYSNQSIVPLVFGDTICPGDTAILRAIGPNVGTSYEWFADSTSTQVISIADSLVLLNILNDTSFFVRANVNTLCANAPRIRVNLVVNQVTGITPMSTNDTICLGDTAILVAFGSGIGANYSWFSSPISTIPLFLTDTVMLSGLVNDTVFYVTSGNGSNCTNNTRIPVFITVNSASNIVPLALNDTICIGDVAQLIAFGSGAGASYLWYDNLLGNNVIFSGANFSITGLVADTTVYVTTGDGTNCSNNTRVAVSVVVDNRVNTPPSVIGDTICRGDVARLQAINGGANAQYTWFDAAFGGNIISRDSIFFFSNVVNSPTVVYVTSGSGLPCSNNTRIPVFVYLNDSINGDFVASLSPIQSTVDVTFTYQGTAVTAHQWFLNSFNNPLGNGPSVLQNFPDSGAVTMILIVTSADGCADTIYRSYNIELINEYTLFAPNAFSPNRNGLNDRFVLKGNNVMNYNIQIFDRWGALVYEGNDLNTGWDGILANGLPANSGIYAYFVKAEFTNGTRKKLNGVVHLIR